MATKTLNFTKKALEAIEPPPKGRDTYRDRENKYLHLRVGTSGTKAFYLIRWAEGKAVFSRLGVFPEMPVAEARRQCAEEGVSLAKGESPKAVKSEALTFADLFTNYMQGHAKPHKRTWPEDQRKYDTILGPRWGEKLVPSITTDTANRLHKELGKERGEYLANRTLELLRSVFNYGMNTQKLAENPCIRVKRFPERSRDRFLSAEELKSFFAALEAEPQADWRDFFGLALWTGARRGNVQAMEWDHIDFQEKSWRIPGEQFKNGDPFTVVLEDPALEILKRRKLAARAASQYVFPADGKTGHIVEPRKAWARILARAGGKLADVKVREYVDTKGRKQSKTTIHTRVRIHDLRRTLGSWQAATGTSLQMIGKTLGHKSTTATQIYAHMNLDPVRASVKIAQAAMLEAINGDKDNE